MHGFRIRGAWLRRDTLEECAQKTRDFLQEFINLYPDWIPFNNTSTKKACTIPMHEVPIIEELKKIIVEGRDNFYDTDERGSGITYFNWGSSKISRGNYKKMVEIDINCGAYNGYYNRSVISFPPFNEDAINIVTKEFFKIIFDLLLRHWTPLYGRAMFPIFNDSHESFSEVGWLTYFSNELGDMPLLPSWTKIIPVAEIGTYIQITDEISSWENEDDLIKIVELSEIITPWLEGKKKSIQQALRK
jgi:hypothetical protein